MYFQSLKSNTNIVEGKFSKSDQVKVPMLTDLQGYDHNVSAARCYSFWHCPSAPQKGLKLDKIQKRGEKTFLIKKVNW